MRIPRVTPAAAMLALAVPSGAAGQEPLFRPEAPAEAMVELTGAFSCPVDKLIALYSSLAPAELPAMLAVESEVLLICAERQERLRAIMTAELELRELMDIGPPPPGAPRISVAGTGSTPLAAPAAAVSCPFAVPAHTLEPEQDAGTEDAAETPAAPVTVAEPPVADTRVPVAEAATGPAAGEAGALPGLLAAVPVKLADSAAEAPAPVAPVHACGGWSWIWTVRTSQGGQLAGIRDASGNVIEVKEQDRLGGGLIVGRISREGVFVQDSGGRLVPLPRAAAAGSPVGAGQGDFPEGQR